MPSKTLETNTRWILADSRFHTGSGNLEIWESVNLGICEFGYEFQFGTIIIRYCPNKLRKFEISQMLRCWREVLQYSRSSLLLYATIVGIRTLRIGFHL